ncbi:hypothetical protein CO051_01485 [Candidatus Roizmanbacteria bacterium CG_4_9_14_0_2_um_filter_39_13]|uniref:Uncharacterized protein n=2 Tax=Candidatus Roizmaniibacteriota TaxID=1752723 RepID=A0A2M8F2A7_9BACT|nr:MAG: hypothetical protein COY15_05740 [Candidatus Roizmanbacteria bacterium CG_4_10_14_0_2_um_filter_39_12]PJC33419.1 MAG: hypothetical protein CO051_01485 [Candidatus Roizmanbacteria bacterium CG_4_9_14_0_2_um_filter_39_13]PJE62240.1 MAG: hypothetical protein COU87_00375 [Candidatus Roizmanbacteria bacterium CG10_big_fil_rev_8_21_14_0_10_39_12]
MSEKFTPGPRCPTPETCDGRRYQSCYGASLIAEEVKNVRIGMETDPETLIGVLNRVTCENPAAIQAGIEAQTYLGTLSK